MILKIKNHEDYFNDQAYDALYKYKDRVEVYYGGASSGKSQGVYQKIVFKALNKTFKKRRRILVLRKIRKSIKESSWQHVIDILSDFQILEHCKLNKSDFTIELPNKATILFGGLDDPEKIKSIKGISDIVMEEATEFTLDDFTQLNLRLRDKEHIDKQMFLMFNPVSKKNWVFQYFFKPDGSYNPASGAVLYWSTYKDNRFLDDATRQELENLKNRNPAYYRIYALGQFTTLDKLVFPIYETKIIGKEIVQNLPIYTGLDFGYVNDPSALVSVRYDEQKKIVYVTDEYVKENMLNDEIAQTIIDLGYSKEEIFADSSEPKSIEEIRQKGVTRIESTMKGKDSVITGIQWLLQHKIVIDSRCFKTIEEFENYTWIKDKKTGDYTNEPVDGYNHTIDALRYALNRLILGEGRVEVIGL